MYPESFLLAIQLILTPVIPGWQHHVRAQNFAVFGLHKIVLAHSALDYNYKAGWKAASVMPFRSQLLFFLCQFLIPIPLRCCFTNGQWGTDEDLNRFGYMNHQMQLTVIIFFLDVAVRIV